MGSFLIDSRRFAILLPLSLGVSGCATLDIPNIAAKPLPTQIDEQADINILRSAYQPVKDATVHSFCEKDKERNKSAKLSSNGDGCFEYKNLTTDTNGKLDVKGKTTIKNYLNAGFALTDIYCEQYFAGKDKAVAIRKFSDDTTVNVGSLINAILNATPASGLAKIAAGGSITLLHQGLQSYDTAFTVNPDLSKVRALVKAAQSQYRENVFYVINSKPKTDSEPKKEAPLPDSYQAAQSKILAYAGYCSYSGMKYLVENAIDNNTNDIKNKVAPQPQDEQKNSPTDTNTGKKTTPTPPNNATPTPPPVQQPVQTRIMSGDVVPPT